MPIALGDDKALFARRGARLANVRGANERAVAEHAIALILCLTRQFPLARDNQRARHDRRQRAAEQELGGKTGVNCRPRPHRTRLRYWAIAGR
jgi:D-2-hydroxyacid dehydrogenase (NADP+)